MDDRFITIDELAELLRVTPATVYQWRAAGRGPVATKVGRRVLFRESAVDAWLDAQQTVGAAS